MKKSLLGSIVLSLLLVPAGYVFASSSDVVTLDKTDLEKPQYMKSEDTTTLKGTLLINDSETLANIIEEQKEHDLKDLEKLWQGTVENNRVIEFALKNFCDGQTIVIAGKGAEKYQDIKGVKHPYNDFDVVYNFERQKIKSLPSREENFDDENEQT